MTDTESRQDGGDGGAVQLHRGAHAHLQGGQDDRGHPGELGHYHNSVSITSQFIFSTVGEQAALPNHMHAAVGGRPARDMH